ncbi:OmpH family outer membrane protein [Candidatus Omnitrophota bacterium]
MRKARVFIIVSLVVIVGLGICARAQAQGGMKIGYADVATVFDSYDKTKDEDLVLASKSQDKQKEREKTVEKIRGMKSELELLTEAQRQKKESQIEQEIRLLQDFDRIAKDELRRERDDMLRGILKEIDDVINEYANKNNYTFILNRKVLVFAKEEDDITREIINILNSKYVRKK